MSRQDRLSAYMQSLRGELAEQAAQVMEALAQSEQKEQAFQQLIADANSELAEPQGPSEPEKADEEIRAEEREDRYWGERRDRSAGVEPEEDEMPRNWLAERSSAELGPEEGGDDDSWSGDARRFGHYGED